jgi:hypothetical protein
MGTGLRRGMPCRRKAPGLAAEALLPTPRFVLGPRRWRFRRCRAGHGSPAAPSGQGRSICLPRSPARLPNPGPPPPLPLRRRQIGISGLGNRAGEDVEHARVVAHAGPCAQSFVEKHGILPRQRRDVADVEQRQVGDRRLAHPQQVTKEAEVLVASGKSRHGGLEKATGSRARLHRLASVTPRHDSQPGSPANARIASALRCRRERPCMRRPGRRSPGPCSR